MLVVLKTDTFEGCIINTDFIRYVCVHSNEGEKKTYRIRYEDERWINISEKQYQYLCKVIEEAEQIKKELVLSEIESNRSNNINI